MEKSNQKKVEYMMNEMNKGLWIDTRLSDEEIDFLWDAISEENKEDYSGHLAGNISKSEVIEDKDNWFFETVLKKPTERLFYRDLDAYHKYYIEKEEPPPEFEMDMFWVNYMKQHEFNPLPHIHGGLYSFVIFMKIPTHWKEQHALPISAHSNSPSASDFQFVWSRKDRDELIFRNFSLSPEDEGRILFFPATLQHQVYPFYGTEEERVTISGNIILKEPNKPEIPVGVYEEKEKMLKIIENSVKFMKEELKQMKKAGEKEE
jgi:hypothetical protein